MLETTEYGFTVDFDHPLQRVLYKIVCDFPVAFDSSDVTLSLWAFNVRAPNIKDSVSLDRYLALCAANRIKPFSSSVYTLSDKGFRIRSSSFVRLGIPPGLGDMVTQLHLQGGFDHAILLKGFSSVSKEELDVFSNNYDIGLANLPFYLSDDGVRRGYLRVVQRLPSTTEGVPTLELYVGRDFGLADQGMRGNIFHWVTELVMSSR